eukprot:1176798-Prorocentrum_minimum.AAC.3
MRRRREKEGPPDRWAALRCVEGGKKRPPRTDRLLSDAAQGPAPRWQLGPASELAYEVGWANALHLRRAYSESNHPLNVTGVVGHYWSLAGGAGPDDVRPDELRGAGGRVLYSGGCVTIGHSQVELVQMASAPNCAELAVEFYTQA